MEKIELLAPAGNFIKLKTALYYGADAVYIGGKNFSLRAQADNFTDEELKEAVEYTHNLGKKLYVTVNIFASNEDLEKCEKYFKFLQDIGVDAVIVTDTGLISLCKEVAPNLDIHLSTQANTQNKRTVKFWKDYGLTRVVLARELSLKAIKEIRDYVPNMELEAFIHGAMCISYSGRCLLSNYFSGRDSNKGACVQACRWQYEIREVEKGKEFFPITEDDKGTYILNSKDLNMLDYIKEFIDAGVVSFKIEGRIKSEYYLATVVNSYRRAIDSYYEIGEKYKENPTFQNELLKTAHRAFTTAYMLGENDKTVNYLNSQSAGEMTFMGVCVGETKDGYCLIEMRNRFKKGDELEVLSPTNTFKQILKIDEMFDKNGEVVEDAKIVQQVLKVKTNLNLRVGDMLRK